MTRKQTTTESINGTPSHSGTGKSNTKNEKVTMPKGSTTAETKQTAEAAVAIRKEAELQIDPKTAEVMWSYSVVCDSYRMYPDLPDEFHQAGLGYHARSPGSDVWVWFGDLPDATRKALWEKHRSRLDVRTHEEWKELIRRARELLT